MEIPDEIIVEILAWLSVKSLLRFSCVCKSWKSLISHPSFVNLHLQRSPKNANIVLSVQRLADFGSGNIRVMCCAKCSFMEKPLSTIAAQDGLIRLTNNYYYRVKGSCNGLVCLLYTLCSGIERLGEYRFGEYWVRFLNPATGLRSKKSPRLCVDFSINRFGCTDFGFGYDKSSDTYKVVALLHNRYATEDSEITRVKVYTMGGHCWRDIQRFPAAPFILCRNGNPGRFVNGTLNWLATTIDGLVIVSLDLGKETCKQILLPDRLDKTTGETILVLEDSLCLFLDYYNKNHFVIWQMKEFGVQASWTRLLNVSYQHLTLERSSWYFANSSIVPVCISENGDVLMLIDVNFKTIMYYRKDNRFEYTEYTDDNIFNRFWIDAKDYVQSLVHPR